MSNAMFVQAVALPRETAGKRRLAHGPRRPEAPRGLVALLIESLLEARALAQQANRRFPFRGE